MGKRELAGAVVVVTGASSGIGRTAALMLAARGAHLVLAAREPDELEAVARSASSGAGGGSARAVPTDVASWDDVQGLAHAALNAHGRIDVWINGAAVSAYGNFEDIPESDFRQVVETNLFGCVHGCRAALPAMRRQGDGTIINIASMLSRVPAPYVAPYVVSKYGVRALGGCLRTELMDEPGIHVCTVNPGTIDTPLFRHVANYTGRQVRAMPPVVAVERAARAVVHLAERPRRAAYVGVAARLAVLEGTVLPGLTERVMARYVRREHFDDRPAYPTRGNLYDGLGPAPSDDESDGPRPGDTAEAPGAPERPGFVDVGPQASVPAGRIPPG